MKPKVIVAPEFRRMDEIFDPPTLERPHDLVAWEADRVTPRPSGGGAWAMSRYRVGLESTRSFDP